MPLRLAILGLDPLHRDWLDAVRRALPASQEIELVAAGHRSFASAKDAADALRSPEFPAPPVYDDLRLLLTEAAPQLILMDRPANVSIEFLLACVAQEITVLSLGPPVESLGEAQTLSAVLPPRTHLLYTGGRGFPDAAASRHCAPRPMILSGRSALQPPRGWASIMPWAVAARGRGRTSGNRAPRPVTERVLAWDALASLIDLMDVPMSIYAAIRGTLPAGNSFADLSGAAAITLRFPDDAAANVTLSDRAATSSRELLLWGAGGTLRLGARAYEFRDADGKLIDAGPPSHQPSVAALRSQALEVLRANACNTWPCRHRPIAAGAIAWRTSPPRWKR